MIPKTKEAIADLVVAGAFIAIGVSLPGSLLDKGFEAHLGGIAVGLGLGWLIKTFIYHSKGAQK